VNISASQQIKYFEITNLFNELFLILTSNDFSDFLIADNINKYL